MTLAQPGSELALTDGRHATLVYQHLAATAATADDKAQWAEMLRHISSLLPGQTGIDAARAAVDVLYQLAGNDPTADNPYQAALAGAILMYANRIHYAQPGSELALADGRHAVAIYAHLSAVAATPAAAATWDNLRQQLQVYLPG